jgi:hypothetical protein
MLLELAAANAAYAVIKEAVTNSGELASAGQALYKFFDSKAELQKKAREKGNRSELEEFAALEQLRKQEEELRIVMQWHGRPGLWDDWLKFQSEAKRRREAEEREKRLRKQRIIGRIQDAMWIALVVVLLGGLGVIIGAAIWLARDV